MGTTLSMRCPMPRQCHGTSLEASMAGKAVLPVRNRLPAPRTRQATIQQAYPQSVLHNTSPCSKAR